MISFKEKYNKIKIVWNNYPFFTSIVIFILFFILYGSIYLPSSGTSTVDDHFYNFKLAYLIRTEGWSTVENFDWVHFSKIAQEKMRYPVTLFQLSLMPFTYISDIELGLRISDVFWASFLASIIYYVLRKMKVKFPLLFVLILFSFLYFADKALHGRAIILILGIVFLEIYLATEKKYKKLFFVALFHILWHKASFFMPLMIIAIVEISRYLKSQYFFRKNIFSVFLASILGMAFFPKFPLNIWEWAKDLFDMHWLVIVQGLKGEGEELYKKDIFDNFLVNSEMLFMIFLTSIAIVIYYYILGKKENRNEIGYQNTEKSDTLMYSLSFFSIIIVAGSLIMSGRFYDFYFPSIIFLGAVVFTKITRDGKVSVVSGLSKYILVAVTLFFMLSTTDSFIRKKADIYRKNYQAIGEVAKWIESNSNDKDVIFLHNWSHFARLFFFNHKNVYTMGVEPKLLLDYDPNLYWKWYNIFNNNYYCEKQMDCAADKQKIDDEMVNFDDKAQELTYRENGRKIINSIKDDFGSKFIISSSQQLNKMIFLNDNLIEDSFEENLEENQMRLNGFKLK